MVRAANGILMPAECDFVISGTIDPTATKPEGPFGDHLGYYSLVHDFPLMKVERVYRRPGAIWPFTVVGRPPQEDTSFGELIHELTGPILPTVLPGLHAVNAVDAAGVHPLLLAVGSERYTPYSGVKRPQELLTIANAVLGQGQLSLAKFLLIVAKEDDPGLDLHDIPAFFGGTRSAAWTGPTTYTSRRGPRSTRSTTSAGEGSQPRVETRHRRRRPAAPRTLETAAGTPEITGRLWSRAARRPRHHGRHRAAARRADGRRVRAGAARFAQEFHTNEGGLPLVVLTDDAEFTACCLTTSSGRRSTCANPATDVLGVSGGTFPESTTAAPGRWSSMRG